MIFPNELKYSKSHEWIRFTEEDTAFIGLTDYAQGELGDLVFVNLPDVDDEVNVDEVFADVESVKAVSDVYSPLSGVIAAVNEELLDSPELINSEPYVSWLIEVTDITDQKELLSAEEYEAFLKEL